MKVISGDISVTLNGKPVEQFCNIRYCISVESTLKRLEELSKLQIGWHNGYGAAPSELSINRARKLITEELSKLNTKLYIYPLGDGGISIEFCSAHLNFDIEINNNEDKVSLFCFSVHSYYELEYSYDKLQAVFDMDDKQLQEYIDVSYPS